MVQRNHRPERVSATEAVQAFVVRRPVRRPGGVLDDSLRNLQDGGDGRDRAHYSLPVLADPHFGVVRALREAGRRLQVTIITDPNVGVPASDRDRLRLGGTRFAETFAASPAMVLRSVRGERTLALVAMLKGNGDF